MDPVTLVGVVASSIQIAQFIGGTVQNLRTLKGKFQEADITIRSLINQLSTVKAAVLQISEWAEFNFDDSPKEKAFTDGLNVALDGCKEAMDVLSAEVDDLMAGTGAPAVGIPTTLGMRIKVRAVWSEVSMKTHQERLFLQVQALQLLLTAGQCLDVRSQSRLLGLKENQIIIQKVVDDTKSLRESQSSSGSQGARSARASTVGGTAFDFYASLYDSEAYRSAASRRNIAHNSYSSPPPIARKEPRSGQGNQHGDAFTTPQQKHRAGNLLRIPSNNSEVYMSNVARHTRNRTDFDNENIYRSNSTTGRSTVSEPATHHRFSSSSSTDFTPVENDRSDSSKITFWRSGLKRLNTFSASKLTFPTQLTQSAGASFGSGQRRRHNQEKNITQSIDFTSASELDTATLIRVAQAGNAVEIERLLDSGADIEAQHVSTQRTALAVAAHCGNSEIVRLLLRREAQSDIRDYQLSTPLHLAASRGHCAVMDLLLLCHDVDVEAMDQSQQTALWVAADRGHIKAVEMLLKKGARINIRAKEQMTPLHTAARQGDKDMVDLLLRHKAHIEARDSNSMTAIHHACQSGQESAVDLLLNRGANIEAAGENKKSPLIVSAASGHYHLVTLLSKRRASPKGLDEGSKNALHWSASHGHLEVVEYLLDWKLSLHNTDAQGLTPLHLAVIGLHFAVVDFLLRKGASVDARCSAGKSPLHYACMAGNPDIVRLLLGAGAELETQVNGRTPFHMAAANGRVEILEVLYEKGAQITQRDSAGNRPLCTACQEGHADVVEKLLGYGEPLRMSFDTRPSEDSPLCIASRAGHLDVVRLLIQKGASVKQRDEFGYIPLRYAAYYGHPDVLQLLLEEGAELVDDGEDSHGWGFVLMPDMIGFSDNTDVTEDRRRHVRQLLEEAERNTSLWNRDDTSHPYYTASDTGRNGVRQMLSYQSYGDQSIPHATSTRVLELHGSGGRENKSELASCQILELPGPPGLKSHIARNSNPPVRYSPPASPLRFYVSPAQPHTSQDPPPQGAYLRPPVYYPYAVSPMAYSSPPTIAPEYQEASYGRVSSIPEEVVTSPQPKYNEGLERNEPDAPITIGGPVELP